MRKKGLKNPHQMKTSPGDDSDGMRPPGKSAKGSKVYNGDLTYNSQYTFYIVVFIMLIEYCTAIIVVVSSFILKYHTKSSSS